MNQKTTLLRELKSEFLGPGAGGEPASRSAADRAAMVDFATLDDYRCIADMRDLFATKGLNNPYFISRDGFNRSTIDCGGRSYTSFSGYNYLDLSADERVIEAANQAARRYGTAAGASRMVGGEMELHRELEAELCRTFGLEDCVATVGGYVCNMLTLGYLCGRRDLILYDEYMHNSGIMGAVLSGARRIAFPHNNMAELERLLEEHRDRHERVLILVEGVYSMDGDLCDLPKLLELKRRHGAWLMVDEAHSLGTIGATGRGVAEHFGVDPKEIDIVMGTLSKAFASCGGFIGGGEKVVSLLRFFAPGFLLYSTGLPPTSAGSALRAVQIMREEPWRVQKLQSNVQRFAAIARSHGLDVGNSGYSAVVPMLVGNDDVALRLMSSLLDVGILVHAILYPVVPRHESRLRFFLTSSHTEEQLVAAVDHVRALMANPRGQAA